MDAHLLPQLPTVANKRSPLSEMQVSECRVALFMSLVGVSPGGGHRRVVVVVVDDVDVVVARCG